MLQYTSTMSASSAHDLIDGDFEMKPDEPLCTPTQTHSLVIMVGILWAALLT
jgi:hypothetical protein